MTTAISEQRPTGGYLRAKANGDFSFKLFMETAIENPGLYPSWDELSGTVKFVFSNGELFTRVATCYVNGNEQPKHVQSSHVWPLGHFTALGYVACISTYLKLHVHLPGPLAARISLWPPERVNGKVESANGPHDRGVPYLSDFLLNWPNKLIYSFMDLRTRRPYFNRLSDYTTGSMPSARSLYSLLLQGTFTPRVMPMISLTNLIHTVRTLLTQLEALQRKCEETVNYDEMSFLPFEPLQPRPANSLGI